jgi:hypothetical protein
MKVGDAMLQLLIALCDCFFACSAESPFGGGRNRSTLHSSFGLLTLPQADARAAPIFVDGFDARFFKSPPHDN